jgi:hypothetical protein
MNPNHDPKNGEFTSGSGSSSKLTKEDQAHLSLAAHIADLHRQHDREAYSNLGKRLVAGAALTTLGVTTGSRGLLISGASLTGGAFVAHAARQKFKDTPVNIQQRQEDGTLTTTHFKNPKEYATFLASHIGKQHKAQS